MVITMDSRWMSFICVISMTSTRCYCFTNFNGAFLFASFMLGSYLFYPFIHRTAIPSPYIWHESYTLTKCVLFSLLAFAFAFALWISIFTYIFSSAYFSTDNESQAYSKQIIDFYWNSMETHISVFFFSFSLCYCIRHMLLPQLRTHISLWWDELSGKMYMYINKRIA